VNKERILVDAGPLVAILRQSETHHELCQQEVDYLDDPLYTCWPVIAEVTWLLRKDAVGLGGLFKMFRTGDLKLIPLAESDLPGIQSFMLRYADLPAQFADACLLHLVEREGIRKVFTLDRRDIQVYRIGKNRHLELLPRLPPPRE
jgi:hypothetical protein